MEEDNLFKIHLVQEDEQALEKQRKLIENKINTKEKEISDVNHNIEIIIASKNALVTKQAFLDTNTNTSNNVNTKSKHNNWVAEKKPAVEVEERSTAFSMLQQ